MGKLSQTRGKLGSPEIYAWPALDTVGIPAEVTRTLMKRWPSIFASMATRILRSGVFPARWKTAKLVLIPKAKKNTYRPTCHLDTAAKAVETIILRRLQDELEEKGGLAENQYGFRPGRSTMSALKKLYEEVLREKARPWRRRKRCAIILLDIRNAFNSLEWGVIAGSLQKREISAYVRRIIRSYLQSRYIVDEDGTRHEVTAGVPQGSVLGPTLWNVDYDDVLRLELPSGATTLAYADDLALVRMGTSIKELQEITQDSLDVIANWMEGKQLRLAPEKTEAVMLLSRRGDENPSLHICQHQIAFSQTAKYLGVHLQRRLSGTQHVRKVTKRAADVAAAIARILPRTYGTSGAQRRILATAAESVAMYVAPIWSDMALKYQINRDSLTKAQRICGIRIARSYRKVSTAAVLVLAGTATWYLLARERASKHWANVRRDAPYDSDTEDEELMNDDEIRAETIARWQLEWDSADTALDPSMYPSHHHLD